MFQSAGHSSAAAVSNASPSRASLGGVEAELHFIAADGRKPFNYQFDPPPGQPLRSHEYRAHRVFIRNGRPAADSFSLDREGFALVDHQITTRNLYADAEVRANYYPEAEALLAAETGAEKVVIFDHTIRTSVTPPAGVVLPRQPVQRVHNDYTLKSGPQRVRDLLPPEEAEARLKKRFAIVNVWRPIKGPLQHMPLALGDAATLAPEDLVPSDLIYRDRVGETYAIAYNPNQLWFYFPEMTPAEAVLIKTFDSDPVRARFSAHSAFADPNFPEPTLLRESIELRALVFFG
ncbi:MAG TPA: CmcJ/NvfI family oxidoreductase [Dongiaceae bacterium]|jgi:hypothetical protein